jgi:macrodomain Ter protein organizer (MatP/YcbG family)
MRSAVAEAPKASKNLNVPLVTETWDRLYRIVKRLAEVRGWTTCTLQQAITHLVDDSPLGEPVAKKAASVRNFRNRKARTA